MGKYRINTGDGWLEFEIIGTKDENRDWSQTVANLSFAGCLFQEAELVQVSSPEQHLGRINLAAAWKNWGCPCVQMPH